MMKVAMDIETDSLDATKIWCICAEDIDTGDQFLFTNLTDDVSEREKFYDFVRRVDRIVMHNGIGFDAPTVNRLLGQVIDPRKVTDTLIVSRLVDYNIKGGHSLAAWGRRLGLDKGDFKDFSHLSDEMIDYCKNDVAVTVLLYKKFSSVLKDKQWHDALRIEHDIQIICEQMRVNGFYFDVERAKKLLEEIKSSMYYLEQQFQIDFPPVLKEDKRIKYRFKNDGSLYSTVIKAMQEHPETKVEGEELICYKWQEFNAGSAQQRIERLWQAGWDPIDKTKGHLKNEDSDKAEQYAIYGWMCNETNLNTLPPEAPQSALNLAEWLTLEGRRSSLEEWIGCVGEDQRIHGTFTHIGAWTGRLAHSKPNQANIPAAFHGDAITSVERVKELYDGPFRGLWKVEEGNWLVGTDAEGIQLRILADLMESREYIDAIITGKKEDETDIHNLNRKALGMDHITRDMAKTFIYAFLLGAGRKKIAQILNTAPIRADEAIENFMDSITGLRRLKTKEIPTIAERGYFRGYDGRKVVVPNEHKTLAGMLQNGESTIMKWATRGWITAAQAEGINFKLVTWPHDEWQTEVIGSRDSAERLGQIQRTAIENVGKRLNIMCPLAGSTDIGKSWLDTH